MLLSIYPGIYRLKSNIAVNWTKVNKISMVQNNSKYLKIKYWLLVENEKILWTIKKYVNNLNDFDNTELSKLFDM